MNLSMLVDEQILSAVKRSRHHSRLRDMRRHIQRMKSSINTSASTIARYQYRLQLSLFADSDESCSLLCYSFYQRDFGKVIFDE